MPRRELRFTRAEVRRASGLSDTQTRIHLERLTALEYLLVHSGMRGRSYEYELLHDGPAAPAGAHLSGLIDAAVLETVLQAGPPSTEKSTSTTPSSRGQTGEFAGSSRPHNGPNAGGSRGDESAGEALPPTVSTESPSITPKSRVQSANVKVLSYPSLPALPALPLAAQAA